MTCLHRVFMMTVTILLSSSHSVESFTTPLTTKPISQAKSTIVGLSVRENNGSASNNNSLQKNNPNVLSVATASAFLAWSLFSGAALADGQTSKFKLPPIDYSDPNRCVLKSSSIGQANAARDKLYDLRACTIPQQKAVGYDLSGVITTKTDLRKSNFQDAQFSKAYLHDSIFDDSDFSNAIVDRASFRGSSLRGALFVNTVLTGTSFEESNLENTDFSDAYMGDFDSRSLCKNPTLQGTNPVTGVDTRASAGCK
ncbi:hypothetical protein FisN_4Lh300 [Fistulifera solaris]|uniref:Pentapeptide repeat-containing protein n=1 Tax=Fistulifera solaris TaxID=1519565 RepID=A0A1Z5KE24_FISSO|nr:hypothetical protein FisN_4Lh300 [Fistulifera solaris]|eukprot:GAX24208.1 hypothetical protein FisN_4Lh300 [Fistulifera solaris]